MRARTLLWMLLAVNVLWAAAFFGYVQRPRAALSGPASIPVSLATNISSVSVTSSPVLVVSTATNAPNTPAPSNTPVTLRLSARQYGWMDVTNEAYVEYLARLRAAGCPEKQVRQIAAADVRELMDHRRLEQALKTDARWWKAETFLGIIPMRHTDSPDLDAERRDILSKWFGDNWSEGLKLTPQNATAVDLSGPVLGALPVETWSEVQEISARSSERHSAYVNAHPDAGTVDSVEMAAMRERTRSELSKVLTPEQMEEFLLRYSQNATQLRQAFAGIEVTSNEFRRIFRTVDPMEHRMQVDYGGLQALSAKQREQLEALRDRTMKEVLGAERFAQYLGTKDPLYKQAQIIASQGGLNALAIPPLHELQKNLDVRHNEISRDPKLSGEEKKRALDALVVEHQQMMRRILDDSKYRR